MMTELTAQLGMCHDNSSPYYPQANGQVEAINEVLVTMLQRTVGMQIRNWHLMLFSAFWAYQTTAKTTTRFTHFQFGYGLEATISIECEIPSLKIVVELLLDTSTEEEWLIYLESLDETHRIIALVIEAQNKQVKAKYNKTITPCFFAKGDLALLYDQANDKLGAGKFKPMWHGPYIVKRVL